MSNRWWEKKRRERHSWFDVFHEFRRIEKMLDYMMRQASRSRPLGISKKDKSLRPHVYGFSVTIGPDGRPRIKEIGNVQRTSYGPRISEQRKPLVDVLNQEEEVLVVAQLPGVEKDDINLHAAGDKLVINVDTQQKKFHKELSMPKKVDSTLFKTSYKNGVFVIRFKKKHLR